MTLEEHLAVPYRLVAYAAVGEDGTWKRRASYPEIGCSADADTLVEAMDELERKRVEYIVRSLAAGRPIPVPRPPLRSTMRQLEHGRIERLKAEVEAGPG